MSHFKRFLSGYDPRVRFLVDGINDNESLLYFTTSQNKAVVSLTLDSLYKFISDLSKFSSPTKMTPIVKLSELQSNTELFRSCLNFNVIEARSSQSNIMTASSKKILVGDYTDTILELIDKPITRKSSTGYLINNVRLGHRGAKSLRGKSRPQQHVRLYSRTDRTNNTAYHRATSSLAEVPT